MLVTPPVRAAGAGAACLGRGLEVWPAGERVPAQLRGYSAAWLQQSGQSCCPAPSCGVSGILSGWAR